ncbi:MAG: alanine racemase [Bacilli bacterium]
MIRQTYEEVYLKNIEYNVKTIIEYAKDYSYHIAVVKADCYALGIKAIKSIIKGGANYLAVSSLEEALKVRKITNLGILVLEPINTKYTDIAFKNNITLTISSLDYLKTIKDKKFKCHIKIDSNMNRLGINNSKELDEVISIINESNIELEGIYTHIYKASDINTTDEQFRKFEEITKNIDLSKIKIVHIPNSDTLVNYKKKDYINGHRMGIIMYGFNNKLKLKNTFSVISKVLNIKEIKKGQTVGYDGAYTANEDEIIAILPIGYADGITRNNTGRYVYIKDKKYKIVGNVCMDMLFILVDKSIKVGDIAYVIKDIEHTNEIARHINTINYEVMCNIGSRVERVYKN